MLTIDLMMPVYYKTKSRETLTFLQLKYLENLYSILKEDEIIISLTVVGEEDYKNKLLKYLDFNCDNSFVVFNQNNFRINYQKSFYKNKLFQEMLHRKIRNGLIESFNKKKDCAFFMGSNDFMCIDFFYQLKSNYNNLEKQLYGIHKSNNSITNYSFIYNFKNNKFIKISSWNGVYSENFYKRNKFNCFGALIGFNKLGYNDILSNGQLWNEKKIESDCLRQGFKSIINNNCFYLNIKSDEDLTNLSNAPYIKSNYEIKTVILDNEKKMINILEELLEKNSI